MGSADDSTGPLELQREPRTATRTSRQKVLSGNAPLSASRLRSKAFSGQAHRYYQSFQTRIALRPYPKPRNAPTIEQWPLVCLSQRAEELVTVSFKSSQCLWPLGPSSCSPSPSQSQAHLTLPGLTCLGRREATLLVTGTESASIHLRARGKPEARPLQWSIGPHGLAVPQLRCAVLSLVAGSELLVHQCLRILTSFPPSQGTTYLFFRPHLLQKQRTRS